MEIVIGILLFLLGTILASFGEMIIYRVPKHLPLLKTRSSCESCNAPIKWYDNIPILSFIILKGRCRNCHAKIGWFSIVLEVLGGLSFLLAFIQFRLSYELIFVLALACLFIIMGGIDYETHYIYDLTQVIYFLIALGYVLFKIFYLKETWYEYLIGAGGSFAFFFLIKFIGKKIFKTNCIGDGDIILMTITGMLLGYKLLLLVIIFASFIGLIVQIILVISKKKRRRDEIAFAPYILIGTYLVILYGNLIVDAIL